MPISRDPRMDRRRRVLRDNNDQSTSDGKKTRPKSGRSRSKSSVDDAQEERRGAGYSQDVRRACGQRLVQLIPVRRRSFVAAILLSLLVPSLLMTAHYLIYVNGRLEWYGHPLAVALDASHASSIAAWFSSHLWLLCLGTTVLTFQLRRHKLDDYDGDYRLWFWLVITCLIASIDATTGISSLFGLALDRWSQINLGWSGPAVVQATLAVMIGMLGLRLCTELKSVPTSLLFWLVGLVAWAGAAALGQEELNVNISLQFRIWLKTTLWLGGLTAVWLASLTYLRSVYIDAQRRFLARGRLAASTGVPLGTRFRNAMPNMPSLRRGAVEPGNDDTPSRSRWALPGLMRRKQSEEDLQDNVKHVHAKKHENENQETAKKRVQKPEAVVAKTSVRESEPAAGKTTEARTKRGLGSFLGRSRNKEAKEDHSDSAAATSSRRGGWFRKPKDSDEPDEYRKVNQGDRSVRSSSKETHVSGKTDNDSEPRPRRAWIPKFSRPKFSRPKMPAIPKPKVRGWFSKLKLPSLRLPPPGEAEPVEANAPKMRSVTSSQQLPGTDPGSDDGDAQPARPLSKAERKRQRRMQRNRAA